MKRLLFVPVLIAALLGANAPVATPLGAHAVIEKMLADNPSLVSYKARVHVNTHMISFPFLSPSLDGTSYFKRPNNYEVIFDRVPSYAKGFSKLFNDVGDPSGWEKVDDVSVDQPRVLDGKPMLVLRLTTKKYSVTMDYMLAYVDPQNYTLARMEFYYRNGGTISMSQKYRNEGPYQVIDSQHADISIPHVRAVADSTYGVYQTNVAVDQSVFAKQ